MVEVGGGGGRGGSKTGLPLAGPGEGWVEGGGIGVVQGGGYSWGGGLASMPEGVDVVVQADSRPGGGAVTLAALPAAAALDPHDVAGEALAVRAQEAEASGAGEGGRAAAAVCTCAAGARAVAPGRGTSGEGDPDWLLRANRTLALLCSLDRPKYNKSIQSEHC